MSPSWGTANCVATEELSSILRSPKVQRRVQKDPTLVMKEMLVEWTVLSGETEVLGENLPRRQFVHYKYHLPDPGANPGRRGGTPATNRFSYGAASLTYIAYTKVPRAIFPKINPCSTETIHYTTEKWPWIKKVGAWTRSGRAGGAHNAVGCTMYP
jgi:hypothetical protein